MAQVSKINGISIPNTSITGYTYDGVNTFTITQNDGVSFTAQITSLSASTISGGTFYGDGSNLTGIISTDNYVTGGTLNSNSIEIGRTDSASILVISGGTNVSITEPLSGTFLIDSTGGSGEVNTASNVGVGQGVFSGKSGTDLQFYSLSGGTNTTLTLNNNTIVIDTSGSVSSELVTLDFSFDGTYVNSSTSFGQIPLQIVIQSATTYNSNFSTMNGQLICDVSQTDSGINGEFDLFNLTDSAQVTGSVTSFTDTDGLKSSSSFSIGNTHFDNTFRVRLRRTSGTGANDVRIRAAQLILTLT